MRTYSLTSTIAILALLLHTVLPATAAPAARLESEHFIVRYDPDRLPAEAARQALEAAERGWEHCRSVFGKAPTGRIACDLTPRFFGATGFATPSARSPQIGVRYADLEYLGLSGPYVLTHEIAHVFSGQNAGGPLGEGLADFVAGPHHEMPLAPWWGRALQEAGVWTDADGLFITGEYPATNELDARVRVSQYVQPALLIQFLARRFGFPRVEQFLPIYTRTRYSLASNDGLSARPAGPPGARRAAPRQPDPAKVRAAFTSHFGLSWEVLRDEWLAEMAAAVPPEGYAGRLVLSQEIYAAIRGYEGWLVSENRGAPDGRNRTIRETFTRANRALRVRDLGAAAEELQTARRLIDAVRRPVIAI